MTRRPSKRIAAKKRGPTKIPGYIADPVAPAKEPEVTLKLIVRPVIILAPPRSFTSVICAMLGQHPQLYGLPELQLFPARTIADWWRIGSKASFAMRDGLHRAIAELCFGDQSEFSVECARGWLRRRWHYTSGIIIEEIARKVHPRAVVEKSPSTVYRPEFLQRAFAMFPQARFLHLTRHPIMQGESVMKAIRDREQSGPVPYWLLNLASYPYWPKSRGPERVLDLDPQRGWYELNLHIREFLKSVPEHQQMRVRGEDFLSDPDRVLAQVTAWLDLRSDRDALEKMRHPEHSPYARLGPANAALGNDPAFLADPSLRPDRAVLKPLKSALSWRTDGRILLPEVRQLAIEFGYE
jgi:Sulfotransferase family